MESFFLSLFVAALVGALIGVLSPEGGLEKYLRLVISLFFCCVLIAPLPGLIQNLSGFVKEPPALSEEEDPQKLPEELQDALTSASKIYFSELLTERLEQNFSIKKGEIRCVVLWKAGGTEPEKITLLLSGKAIWKNTAEIEDFVEKLIGCECVTAIE